MLTLNYLQSILANDYDANVIIESPDGLEALTELCQHRELPLVILFEDAFHYDDDDHNDVPVTRFRQSIYVMRMVSNDEGSHIVDMQAFNDVNTIRRRLMEHVDDDQLVGWMRTSTRDYVSHSAARYVGWKLSIPFTENESIVP